MNLSLRLKKWSVQALANSIGYLSRHLKSTSFRRTLVDKIYEPYFGWRQMDISCRTQFGHKIHLHLPDAVQTTIFLTGQWEPMLTAFVCRSLKPGDIFIDVGANVGYYTLLASKLVGETGRVYSFEASPMIFKKLEANIRGNNLKNVHSSNVAIGRERGVATIWIAPKGNIGHSTIMDNVARHDGHERETEVLCDALSELIPLPDLTSARIVKLDIEGAERLALEGLIVHFPAFSHHTEWLVELSPEFSPGGVEDISWIFNSFVKSGYSAYRFNSYPSERSLSYGVSGLVQITEPPSDRLSDVLFSKNSIPLNH